MEISVHRRLHLSNVGKKFLQALFLISKNKEEAGGGGPNVSF
jgi:hypothetical protein